MAEVIFYEKPGCINNTRQKKILTEAGHTVIARSLLTHKWSVSILDNFFYGLPIKEWFNKSAPRIKSGEINPDLLSKTAALEYMVADPLLIRRPLMIIEGRYHVGFDVDQLQALIGLTALTDDKDLESCPRMHTNSHCSDNEK